MVQAELEKTPTRKTQDNPLQNDPKDTITVQIGNTVTALDSIIVNLKSSQNGDAQGNEAADQLISSLTELRGGIIRRNPVIVWQNPQILLKEESVSKRPDHAPIETKAFAARKKTKSQEYYDRRNKIISVPQLSNITGATGFEIRTQARKLDIEFLMLQVDSSHGKVGHLSIGDAQRLADQLIKNKLENQVFGGIDDELISLQEMAQIVSADTGSVIEIAGRLDIPITRDGKRKLISRAFAKKIKALSDQRSAFERLMRYSQQKDDTEAEDELDEQATDSSSDIPVGFVDAEEFFKILDISSKRWYQIRKHYEINNVRIGRKIYFSKEEAVSLKFKRDEEKSRHKSKSKPIGVSTRSNGLFKKEPQTQLSPATITEFAEKNNLTSEKVIGIVMGHFNWDFSDDTQRLSEKQQRLILFYIESNLRVTSEKPKRMQKESKAYAVPEGHISRATLINDLGISENQFHNHSLNRLVTPRRIGVQNFYSPEQVALIKDRWREIKKEKLDNRMNKSRNLQAEMGFEEAMNGSTEQNSNDLDLYALHLNEIGQIPIEIKKHKLWAIQISSAQIAADTLFEVLKSPKLTPMQREQIVTTLDNKTAKFMVGEFQKSVESTLEEEVFDNIFRKLEKGSNINKDNEGYDELFIHTIQSHGNWIIKKLSEIDSIESPEEAHAKLQKLIDSQLRLIGAGKEAHDQLVGTNMRLVVSIAKKYTGSLELADAEGYGYEGLMRAASKFDWRMGFQFSTYATWWIKQSITRAVADYSSAIRLPVHAYEELSKITNARRQAVQDLGREISIEDFIDSYPNLTSDTKKALKQAVKDRQMVSLNTPVGDEDDSELGDLLEDKIVDVPEQAEMLIKRQLVEEVLNTLDPRERRILRLRFGLEDGKSRTLDQVGNVFGVTRERIRQIESKAIRKLRHPSRSRKLRAFADADPKSKSIKPGEAAGARTFRK